MKDLPQITWVNVLSTLLLADQHNIWYFLHCPVSHVIRIDPKLRWIERHFLTVPYLTTDSKHQNPEKKPDVRKTSIPDPNPSRLHHEHNISFSRYTLYSFKVFKNHKNDLSALCLFNEELEQSGPACYSSSLKLYDVTEWNSQTQDSRCQKCLNADCQM